MKKSTKHLPRESLGDSYNSEGITTLVLELHNFDHSKLHIEIMLAVRIEILF